MEGGGRVSRDNNVFASAYKAYVERGFAVLPAAKDMKRPLVEWKKYQDKAPSLKELEELARRYPDANIAILQGVPSGNLLVLDFDGEELFKLFMERIRVLPGTDPVKIDIANTWWIKTRRGYHVYLRVDIDPEKFKELFKASREIRGKAGKVEIRGQGGIVLAPPSMHPDDPSVNYEFATLQSACMGPRELCPDDVEEYMEEPAKTTLEAIQRIINIIEEVAGTREKHGNWEVGGPEYQTWGCRGEPRRLSGSTLIEVKEMLKPAYRPGQRQFLALFLAGWMAKAGVHPADAAKAIKLLHEETGDSDNLKTRLSAVAYSYRKSGCWSEELRRELVEEVGVEPYGAKGGPEHRPVKGKSGLQEILEETLGEEQALEVIRRLEEILGVSSPWRDSIIELLDYDKQLYAVANLRKLILVRARRDGDKLVYKERVAVVAPTELTVYMDPLGGITKYEVVFEGQTLRRPLRLGPAPLDDIIARLRLEGLVYSRRLIEDVLSAIIQGMIRKGRADVKEEIDKPGFYWINGELKVVRVEFEKPTDEELRAALELLNELATDWYRHAAERFATAVKWGLIAPFSYAIKQRGRWIQWLMLYGSSKTGKTTIGDIILNIWELGSQYRKTGASIDTVPRLGHVLSSSTFPVLINEPGAAFHREDVMETLKNAADSTVVRGRYMKGTYVEIPPLAPLIITSNKSLPRDDALARRFIVLRFTFNDRIPDDKVRKFEETVKPRLRILKALGAWVAQRVLSGPSILEEEWKAATKRLLEEAYREAGLQPPRWIALEAAGEEDPYDDIRQAILDYIIDRINREYFRAIGRIEVVEDNTYTYKRPSEATLAERIRIAAETRLVPWLAVKDGKLVFLSGLARELRDVVGDLGGLRSIAELMGWGYGPVRLGGRVVKAAHAGVDEFTRSIGFESV